MKWLEAFLKGVDTLSKLFTSLEKLGEIFGGKDKKGGTGSKKSEVYKAMNKEGQEKVNGFKKALDAARDANNRPEAVRVLKELSNVYAQQSRLMTNLDPKLKAEAKVISNNLRELADKVATHQDAIPRGSEVSQNSNIPEQVIASNRGVSASALNILITENDSDKMYNLAIKTFKTNTDSGLNATPLDLFKIMVNYDVDHKIAKEIVLSHNSGEKDSLEAIIDSHIDASKEKSPKTEPDKDVKVINKQAEFAV